jgi:hypothetical protein
VKPAKMSLPSSDEKPSNIFGIRGLGILGGFVVSYLIWTVSILFMEEEITG